MRTVLTLPSLYTFCASRVVSTTKLDLQWVFMDRCGCGSQNWNVYGLFCDRPFLAKEAVANVPQHVFQHCKSLRALWV